MAGARWVQEELLASVPSAELKVYAVWFSVFPTDSRESWPRELLSDWRVLHFWDEGRIVGRWFGEHPAYGTFQEDRILWDAWLLYGPEARWSEKPSHLVGWGYTIIGKREELRRSLLPLVPSSGAELLRPRQPARAAPAP